MWNEAVDRVRDGEVEVDAVLAASEPDCRRGLTLALRPPREVQVEVTALLDELRGIEPALYLYEPDELHITFLTLVTAAEPHDFLARVADYIEAAHAVAGRVAPQEFEFRGVTVSPAAVVVQGFADAEMLKAARDELRRELRARHLAQSIDIRYRLEGAQMTVARFRAPLRNPAAFIAKLECARQRPFGTCRIEEAELTINDWYMSRAATEVKARVPLCGRVAAS